jgi:hypothetical protein
MKITDGRVASSALEPSVTLAMMRWSCIAACATAGCTSFTASPERVADGGIPAPSREGGAPRGELVLPDPRRCEPPSFCLTFDADPAASGWTTTGTPGNAVTTGATPPAVRFATTGADATSYIWRDLEIENGLLCELDVSVEGGAATEARLFGLRLAPAPQGSFEYWYAEWGANKGRGGLWAYFKSTALGYNEGFPLAPWTDVTAWTHLRYSFSRAAAQLRVDASTHPPLVGPVAVTNERLTFRLGIGVIDGTSASAGTSVLFDNVVCTAY